MNSGVLVRTDRISFERWAQALAGVALPEELRPVAPAESGLSGPGLSESGLSGPGLSESGSGAPGPALPAPMPVPPVVAASLALHGYSEIALTVQVTMPDRNLLGCFGLVGGMAASLVRSGEQIEIGLFELGELVDQVIRLVPVAPPPPLNIPPGQVRITVIGADAAVPGWQQTLIGGRSHWRRQQTEVDLPRLDLVADVHRELAADLRFALADSLAGNPRVRG